ncbi:Mitoferrin [Arthrobotrys entomopaga]|nr:Mitoferrin [Arthrobotrys entomopaga]
MIIVIKVRLQTGARTLGSTTAAFETWTSPFKGAAAPVLGHSALAALLFVGYNRSLEYLESTPYNQPIPHPSLTNVWIAGAISGLACFVVSAPTEIIKCRAQVYDHRTTSSWKVMSDIWHRTGVKGFYQGGVVTGLRDSIGFGWYFWAYEASKNMMGLENETVTSLVAGGIAGCVTWASIYPLDVIKTRVQTQSEGQLLPCAAQEQPLIRGRGVAEGAGAWEHAKGIYSAEGLRGYFSGFWWCMGRSFFVNAVQWALYVYLMRKLNPARTGSKDGSFGSQEQGYNL